MGREDNEGRLNDLVQRLRGVTERSIPKLSSTVGINPRYEGVSIWSEKILNNPDGPAAADALEAQAKRIAELEKRINSLEQEEQEWLFTQLEERNDRIAELRAALKPFADANQSIIIFEVQWVKATEGDVRQARKVLGEKE